MQISDEFKELKTRCLEVWNTTSAASPELVTDIYKQVGPFLGPRMRMGFYDVRPNNSQEWQTHTIHEMDCIKAFKNADNIFSDRKIMDHKNKHFLNEIIVPRLKSAISLQSDSTAFIKCNIEDSIIGYESLYIPQKSLDKPEWVIFISNIRFFLKEVELTKLDKVDAAIIQLLIEGETAKEIAITLDTNYRTIEYRISRLKTMLNARNTIQLVALLVGNQLSNLMRDICIIPTENLSPQVVRESLE